MCIDPNIKTMAKKLTWVLLAAIFGNSCIKQAALDYRTPQALLVVEGLLLTDSTPCKVTLSYSGLFNSKYGYQDQAFINDAKVYVKSNAGDSVELASQGSGRYTSAGAMHAQAGNSYFVSITLANGKRYASFPEKIVPVPKSFAIDSIGEVVPYNLNDLFAADIRIRAQDPVNEKNYYRWISVDWLPRKATGVYCGSVPPCFQFCFQQYQDPNVNILSDANVNGSEIRYQPALVSPYYYYGRHYIELKQLSLTEHAYQFWQLYKQQTGSTGSILDPIPSSIQGNIYNVDDTTELALGYFEASDVSSLKFVVAPNFLNSYFTLMHYKSHEDVGACYLIYPNAQTDAPAGWETAPEYLVKVY